MLWLQALAALVFKPSPNLQDTMSQLSRPKKGIFPSFFYDFFGRFSIYLAPSGAKYCARGIGRFGKRQGVIGKSILGVLTFFGKAKLSSRDPVGC